MASIPGGFGPQSMGNDLESHPPEDYTVGWICALPIELKAAQVMLDRQHNGLQSIHAQDRNTYVLGSVGKHNVVLACLAEYGTVRAAKAATMMQYAFSSLRFGLMVGIGGGIPTYNDIRLGDLVISNPSEQGSGVVQYDMGRSEKDGWKRVGALSKPPTLLLTTVNTLRAVYRLEKQISELAKQAFKSFDDWAEEFKYPGVERDRLFEADRDHIHGNLDCDDCVQDTTSIKTRDDRKNPEIPNIHYGNIASGNRVVKNAIERDYLAEKEHVICFEMEAAGLVDDFPCLVIRGVSDYADSHKNGQWQPYAAAIAAAYAKRLLQKIPPQAVEKLDRIRSE